MTKAEVQEARRLLHDLLAVLDRDELVADGPGGRAMELQLRGGLVPLLPTFAS